MFWGRPTKSICWPRIASCWIWAKSCDRARHAIAGGLHTGERFQRHGRRVVARQERGSIPHRARAKMMRQQGMYGGPAAPDVVAVHPVVVDQEIRLQKLERRSGVERYAVGRLVVDRAVSRDEQGRAEPLSSAHGEIAQGVDEGDDVGSQRIGVDQLALEDA